MQEIFNIPVCRFYSNQIILYNTYSSPLPRSTKQIENQKNLTRGDYNGYMSPKTKSKVKKYLATWLKSVELIKKTNKTRKLDKNPYITFVTLTMPEDLGHEDKWIKRHLLTPFIQHLQREYNVWNYFWRAESQPCGRIHFHLFIDSYIHWEDLRADWNAKLEPYGYIDAFEAVWGHRDPNSTDIHALEQIHNVEAYAMKYVSKSEGYRPIEGRIHGCSDGLKKLTPYECLVSNEINDLVTDIINEKHVTVNNQDAFTIISFKNKNLVRKLSSKIAKEIREYHYQCAIDLYTIDLPIPIPLIVEKEKEKVYVQARFKEFEYLYEGC